MKKRFFLLFWLLVLLFRPLLGQELVFQGHLSQEKLLDLTQQFKELEKRSPKELYIVVQSRSGDAERLLDLAKELYAFREKEKCRYVVLINDEALGPGAILPFLADDLYISPTVSWGAVESSLPNNVLRSKIHALISPTTAHEAALKELASAMIDPELQVSLPIEKKKGETLVLNQFQIKALGLAKETTTLEDFTKHFQQKVEKDEKKALLRRDRFEDSLKEYVHFDPTKPPRVGYINLTNRQESISQSTWIYFNSALNAYKESKPSAIILEINSPGGEVFAAERISDALKEIDTQYGIPVICYIDNWAISAGAMLAYSSRYIVVAKDASMGAAEPITVGSEGKPETASEKVNSALRTDFSNRAKFFGRNPYIAEAMVDKDVILVKRHDKIIKLDSEDQIRKGGIDPDIIISPKGKLLTLNADQLIEYDVADCMLAPISLPPLTKQDEESGHYSFAKSPLSQIDYFKKVPNLMVDVYQMNWQMRFLAFLASPAVSSLLFMIMLISFYMELSSGGFGLPGAMALISLFLVLLSSFALEAIHWLEPILLLFGLLLIVLELFFFPTLGILGVIGTIFMIMGLAGMMLPGLESFSYQGDGLNAAGEYVLNRLTWLSGALLISFVIIAFLSRYMWPKIGLFKKLILSEANRSEAAIEGTLPPSPLTALPEVGASATVSAALRPAGKVMVANEEYDALSSGNFIPEGAKVRVVRIEGTKVVVEEIY